MCVKQDVSDKKGDRILRRVNLMNDYIGGKYWIFSKKLQGEMGKERRRKEVIWLVGEI